MSPSDDVIFSNAVAHLVAMPYPGRGHINPMLNLCRLLSSRSPGPQTKTNPLIITFVVTEEWHGFLRSEEEEAEVPLPPNIRFGIIPQVIPSEIGRAADFHGFLEATLTKLEAPFDHLLDGLQPPPTAIVYDAHLMWMIGVGTRRKIPVASLYPMSASVFTVFFHFDLLVHNGHFPFPAAAAAAAAADTLRVDYIPGLPATTTIADLPTLFHGVGRKTLHRALEMASSVPKAQYLLLTSAHELEQPVIDALKSEISIPIYPIGPLIPYYHNYYSTTEKQPPRDADAAAASNRNRIYYLDWLDAQPESSVLYVSMGSFLSVPGVQMDEIVAGIQNSGVRYMWVTRGEDSTSRFKEDKGEEEDDSSSSSSLLGKKRALLVPWCDQLKVLCHPSIGGFWTHCGWNSTWEGVFSGVPMLTFPIFWDQGPNSKMIVDDWKIGRRVRKSGGVGVGVGIDDDDQKNVVVTSREDIAETVRSFMDLESEDRKEMMLRVKRLQRVIHSTVAQGGSAASNLDAFLQHILPTHHGTVVSQAAAPF